MIRREDLHYMFRPDRNGGAVLPADRDRTTGKLLAMAARFGLGQNDEPIQLACLCGGVVAAEGCVLVFGAGSRNSASLPEVNPPGLEQAGIFVIAADQAGGLYALDRTSRGEDRILYLDGDALQWRVAGRFAPFSELLWWLARQNSNSYQDLVYGPGRRLPPRSLQSISTLAMGKIEAWLQIWRQQSGGKGRD